MKSIHRLAMVLLSVVALAAVACSAGISEPNLEEPPLALVTSDEAATPSEPLLDVHEAADDLHLADDHDAVVEDENNHEVDEHAAVLDADEGDVTEVILVALEGRPWSFEPSVIEVPAGRPVRLTLVNDGRAEHDVEITGLTASNVELIGGIASHEALGGGHHREDVVAAHAMPGTTASVTFMPMLAGEYEFACTLPGHKEAGMVGRLIVTPSLAMLSDKIETLTD